MKRVLFLVLLTFTVIACEKETFDIIDNYDNPQKALLVIDMQIDYIDKNGKFPIEKSQIDNLLKTTNEIIEEYNTKGYYIIYLRNLFKKNNAGNPSRNYAAIEGTAGAEIDPRINIVSNYIFDKYSPTAFSSASFENFLIQNQINELYLCGVMADGCVYKTAISAFDRGYFVNCFANAIGSVNNRKVENTIKKLRQKGINIIEF